MQNLPKWLPEVVATHCNNKLQSGALSKDQKACILRLTTQDDMRSVWQALSKVATNPDKLVDLIEHVRLHQTILSTESKISRLTTSKQRKVMQHIALMTECLLNALGQLDPVDSDAKTGIMHLLSELRRLQNHAASHQYGNTVVRLHQNLASLEALDTEYGLIETLQTLQEATTFAMAAPPDGPRKQFAKTATRTAFIQDLKRYIQLHFDKQLNQAVATIVNTAMDLPSETVTEDMVRKAQLPKAEDYL